MSRFVVGITALVLMSTLTGCGWRNRDGLLSRFRGKSDIPNGMACPPYSSVYDGIPNGMPCCNGNGLPYPGVTMPGSILQGSPDGSVQPPNILLPPGSVPMTPPNNPGSASPKAADPSDPASLKKQPAGQTVKSPVQQ